MYISQVEHALHFFDTCSCKLADKMEDGITFDYTNIYYANDSTVPVMLDSTSPSYIKVSFTNRQIIGNAITFQIISFATDRYWLNLLPSFRNRK